MGTLRWLVGVAALVLVGASVVGLVVRDDPGGGPARAGQVQIAGFAYEPATLHVPAGGTVTWVNEDSTAHTVNTKGGAGELSSGSLDQGKSFRHTFATAGTYEYVCSFHPFMHGTIEVGS